MKVEESVARVLGTSIEDPKVESEIKNAKNIGVELIPFGDERYPQALSNINDPPDLIYAWGERKDILKDFSIAIVGSRMASSYGRAVAEKLAGDLARMEIVIVSGLAHGIDSIAHTSAVKNGLTVGVLGTGIDIVYPRSKKSIFEDVKKHGCLVSEFPLGTQPTKWTFPKRNRIIAGLSMGTLVVEASLRSGSLITARLALENGRDVFAVPGSIFSQTSEGTNNLIKQGAKCVTSVDDILEEFGYIKKVDKKQIPDDPILDLLKDGPKNFEEIAQSVKMQTEEINVKLTVFEMDGVISKDLTDRFKINF